MSRTVHAAAAAALLVLSPALAACGSGDDAARDTAENALHAMGAYDGATFCELSTTADGTKPLKSDKTALDACVKLVDGYQKTDSRGYLAPLTKAKVNKVDTDGDTGSVQLSQIEGLDANTQSILAGGQDLADARMQLKKIDGTWYIHRQAVASATTTASASAGATAAAEGTATATGTTAATSSSAKATTSTKAATSTK